MNQTPVTKSYTFKGKLWKYKAPSAWHFVTLPLSLSTKIRKNHSDSEEGWGRLKALATTGSSSWKTAIWYDTKIKSYLLPIKSPIRKKELLKTGRTLSVKLEIEHERWGEEE